MPVTYSEKAYGEVMTWTAHTRIQYAPNRKSGKSFIRYGKYMKAKTVEDALRLGSFGLDLLFDFERGLLKAVGGPKRKAPPAYGTVKEARQMKNISRTDRMLAMMYIKWQEWKGIFKTLEETGLDKQSLKVQNIGLEAPETLVIQARRRDAQAKAKEILHRCKANASKVAAQDVLEVLQKWGFKENTSRKNVMHSGMKYVHSDTIGMIRMTTGKVVATQGTKRYPEVTQLLCQWFKDNCPAEVANKFCFSSLNLNKNYNAATHRDGNNFGPSMIHAFGKFKGGDLNYWASDKREAKACDLSVDDAVKVNLRDNLLLFDGNLAHSVDDFTGERYSIVFFTLGSGGWQRATKEDVKAVSDAGIPYPTKKTAASAMSLVKGRKTFRTWPCRPERGREPKTKVGGKRSREEASKASAVSAKRQCRRSSLP